MEGFKPNNSAMSQRVFLRIPLKVLVKVCHEGKFLKEYLSQDLSASGIALNIPEADFDHDEVEVSFRTGFMSKVIKTKVSIKNKIKIGEGLRLGCIFIDLSDKDRNHVINYITNFCNYSAPTRAVNLISFFCLADLLVRVFLGITVLFYLFTQLEVGFSIFLSNIPRLIILSIYSISSFSAFVFSDKYFVQKDSKYLKYSFICLSLSLTFVVFKCQQYWANGFAASDIFIVKVFCYSYSLFIVLALFSFVKTAGMLRKVKIVIESEKIHRSHI